MASQLSSRVQRFCKNEIDACRGLRYHWLTRKLNSRKKPLKLYWFRNETTNLHNFGDEISAELIWELFGYRVEWCDMESCDLVAVGSTLNYAEEAAVTTKVFWGTGFIKEGGGTKKIRNFRYAAVRGKTTARRLGLKNVVLGDPGILAEVIYPRSQYKNGKTGIVTHYVDEKLPIIEKLANDDRFVIISALQRPAEVARQISECRAIVSSSLHGIIFADSYDIPNAHVSFSTKVVGGSYKFKDYCSGVDKKYQVVDVDKIFDDDAIKKIIKDYKPIKNKIAIQRRLVKSFPKEIT